MRVGKGAQLAGGLTGTNLFHNILMSVCAQVSIFGSSIHVNRAKFLQKIHFKMETVDFNFK